MFTAMLFASALIFDQLTPCYDDSSIFFTPVRPEVACAITDSHGDREGVGSILPKAHGMQVPENALYSTEYFGRSLARLEERMT